MIIYYSRVEKKIWKPSKYFSLGWKGTLPFIIITVLALSLFRFLSIDYSIVSQVPGKVENIERIDEVSRNFYTERNFVLIISPEFSDLSNDSLKKMESVTRDLENLPYVDFIVSPLHMLDLEDSDSSWNFIPLYESPVDNIDALREKLLSTQLFRKIFIGQNECLGIYAFAGEDFKVEEFGELMSHWAEQYPESVKLAGFPIIKFSLYKMVKYAINWLPVYAFILMFVIEFLIYRKIITALLIGLTSLVPLIWVLGLFPLLGLDITIDNIIAPVLVMGLASSYGIHLLQGRTVFCKLTMDMVLEKISGKIFLAAITTIIGFLPLLISPFSSIRKLGVILFAGILSSLVFSLFCFPIVLKKSRVIKEHQYKMLERLPLPSRKRVWMIPLLVLVCLLLLGIGRIYQDSRIISFMPDSHPFISDNAYFNNSFGGINELEIFCDTEMEGGIVSEEYFFKVSEFIREIEVIPEVSAAIGYTDFVDWIFSRVQQDVTDKRNPDMFFIGETLELLSSNTMNGMQIHSLVDQEYRRHKIIIRYKSNPGFKGWSSYQSMIDRVQELSEEKEIGSVIMGGSAIIQNHLILAQGKSIITGMILFFPILFFLFLSMTKSLVWSLCIISSPFFEVLLYFGLLGFCGIPLTLPSLLSISYILGVSVDDNVFYTYTIREKLQKGQTIKQALKESYFETGSAIFDTSIVIVCVMMALFFSGNKVLVQSGSLLFMSHSFVTVFTIWLLPQFYPSNCPKNVSGSLKEFL